MASSCRNTQNFSVLGEFIVTSIDTSLPSTAELPTCPVLTGIPGAALCPQAAACPQQSLLFANHTQDTRGMPAMFASSYRY